MIKTFVYILSVVIVIAAAVFIFRPKSGSSAVLWHASDIHYISPMLIEDEDFFLDVISRADGKFENHIGEITDEFIADALKAKPDAVILSGDLTLNGSRVSHEEFAEKLAVLKEAGIKVLVIPGNHDITKQGIVFGREGLKGAEGTYAALFREIYDDFGYSDAVSADEESLSYMAMINDSLAVLMIDTNTALRGSVSASTLDWAEKQLRAARLKGCNVIAVTHQNILIHNRLFRFNYQINNSDAVLKLLKRYGVKLNLSGHLHIQHMSCEKGITDIAVSSLAVCPNQYAVLDIAGGKVNYHTEKVSPFEGFEEMSAEFFDRSSSPDGSSITDTFTPEEKELMVSFAREVNREYFAGHIDKIDENAYELWQKVPGFFGAYLDSMKDGEGRDYNRALISLR